MPIVFSSKVYAIEASSIAKYAQKLIKSNGFEDVIVLIRGQVEEVELPEKVDVLLSEPMGHLLLHEQMIRSYFTARDKYLKPTGLMYPSTGAIYVAPMYDPSLHRSRSELGSVWKSAS